MASFWTSEIGGACTRVATSFLLVHAAEMARQRGMLYPVYAVVALQLTNARSFMRHTKDPVLRIMFVVLTTLMALYTRVNLEDDGAVSANAVTLWLAAAHLPYIFAFSGPMPPQKDGVKLFAFLLRGVGMLYALSYLHSLGVRSVMPLLAYGHWCDLRSMHKNVLTDVAGRVASLAFQLVLMLQLTVNMGGADKGFGQVTLLLAALFWTTYFAVPF